MKLTYILFSILAVVSMACEDQLNLTPVNSLTTTTYYKNADDAKAALSGAYSQLGAIYRDEIIVTPNVICADDGIPFLTGNADRRVLWSYAILPTNTFVGNIWSSAYVGIQRANIVISRVPEIDMDESLKNRYVAEAKFLRALHYFNLVRFFGGVPLVTTETNSIAGLNVARATAAEIYAQIEADLAEAELTLPKTYTGTDMGRATQGAAKGLLAKVYLTRAGASAGSPYWEKAGSKAKEVMDLGAGYGLWVNYSDVFSLANRVGKESIFEILFITDLGGTNFSTGYAPRGAPIVPNNGSGIFRVSESLFDTYEADDARIPVTFLTSYTTPSNGQIVNLSVTDPDPAKAVSFWKLSDPTSKIAGNAGKSFPYMRYAEILLIHAEALNESNGGPSPEAYTSLNLVRVRAGLDPVSSLSQNQFRDSVQVERRRELTFEGHRWFDLVRTGKLIPAVQAEVSFGRAPTIENFNNLFPIPQREMDTNPALTGQQNSGY